MAYYNSGVISNRLAEMTDKIAQRLAFAGNFINYSFREEMVGDAVIKMFKALIARKYSHDKGVNPFSYFTRIAWNSFVCRIKKEKHNQDVYEKYKEELLLFADNYNVISKNGNTRLNHQV
jgi:DNA-directed RNA polymerase specialized sigma24 family protein